MEIDEGEDAYFAPRGWYRNLPICENKPGGTSCDEYPFYSTRQGGPGFEQQPAGDLMPISSSDNRRQGSRLGSFYRACSIELGDKFLVLPIKDQPLVPTRGVCAP